VKLAVDLGRPSLMTMVMFLVRFGTLFLQELVCDVSSEDEAGFVPGEKRHGDV
jgi:hypothetical protein